MARGAALASANAPLFVSSTAARAYAQDPGTGAVMPFAVGPGYLRRPAGADAADALAYSAVPDDFADAYTGAHTAATGVVGADYPERRSFELIGSALAAIFIVGVAALVVSLAITIRPTAGVRPDPGHNVVAPAQQPAPAPAPAAPPAPAPAPGARSGAAAPAPAPVPHGCRLPRRFRCRRLPPRCQHPLRRPGPCSGSAAGSGAGRPPPVRACRPIPVLLVPIPCCRSSAVRPGGGPGGGGPRRRRIPGGFPGGGGFPAAATVAAGGGFGGGHGGFGHR